VSFIETKPPYKTRTFMTTMFDLVAVNSGIKHSTGMIHPVRIRELSQGIRELMLNPHLPSKLRSLLSEDVYETKWSQLNLDELDPFLRELNPVSRKRILFTLKMHESTMLAIDLIENPSSRVVTRVEDFLVKECVSCLEEASKTDNNILRAIGGIINYQHILLRDLYDVSTNELEEIRRKALTAGGIGVKISGAGLGGAMLVLVENRETAIKVVKEIEGLSAGAWPVEVDEGVRLEKSKSID